MRRTVGACLVSVSALAACAAAKKEPASAPAAAPERSHGGPEAGQVGTPHPSPASADRATSAPRAEEPAPAPSPPPAPAGAVEAARPTGGAGPPPTRAAVLARAGSDLEAAQRELDVAAGDCRNACRALGSMDRAAGRLCALAQASDELRRCEDARRSVLAARARVKETCGGCPGGPSVERDDPVPFSR